MSKHLNIIRAFEGRIRDRLTDKSSAGARRLAIEVQRIADGLASLERVAVRRSPMQTPEAHLVEVAKLSKKLEIELARSNDRVQQIFRDEFNELQGRIDRNARLAPSKLGPEIRQALREKPEKERLEILKTAVDSGDVATLAAIAEANSLLTGLADAHREAFLEDWRRKSSPDEFQASTELEEHFGAALDAMKVARQATAEGFDPRRLAEIEAAEEAAQGERAKFEQALSD